AARGAELVVGTFEDRAAMRSAMAGVDGVFSVQPSSPGGTVTDEQEVRYGITIADLAVECGVKHLVYSSGSATGETPTGVAHYDTKAEIERHIRRLPLAATIVRPATFMELLVMPGFGLDEGRFQFFMLPEGRMQVLAVEDIGHLVAAVFAAPARFAGKTFEIASDSVTGRQLEVLFSAAAGRPIPYSRFSDEVLAASPFLHKLTGLVDDGRLAGHADLDALR
ncbi:TPA: NmrA family NAD(P)-binding protein, partial [Klebsiella pneumoniae]|nr:NmrA family NAD(P)-binding protein [Klebsiella pneumoniae]